MKTKKQIRIEIQEALRIPWQYDYLNKLSHRDLDNLLRCISHITKNTEIIEDCGCGKCIKE
tara:strand:+ start:131 stop:313 length:183 start_codon:yes stop_codon:yes gene_type:complete